MVKWVLARSLSGDVWKQIVQRDHIVEWQLLKRNPNDQALCKQWLREFTECHKIIRLDFCSIS